MKLRTFLMAGLVTLSLALPASALTLSVGWPGPDCRGQDNRHPEHNLCLPALCGYYAGPDCPGGLEGRKGVGDH